MKRYTYRTFHVQLGEASRRHHQISRAPHSPGAMVASRDVHVVCSLGGLALSFGSVAGGKFSFDRLRGIKKDEGSAGDSMSFKRARDPRGDLPLSDACPFSVPDRSPDSTTNVSLVGSIRKGTGSAEDGMPGAAISV